MNAALEEVPATARDTHFVVRSQGRLRRSATRFTRFVVGVLLTQSLVGAILVAGWVRRRMQHATYARWWRIAGNAKDEGALLRRLSDADPELAVRVSPRWVVHEQPRAYMDLHRELRGRATIMGALGAAGHSLWLNGIGGLGLLFHTSLLTLPATVLWAFSWRYGWDNSFHFGYEYAYIGPTLGLAGVALFIVAMCYIPLAQARMAAANHWRAFYELRLVLRLIRRKWGALLLLAVGYFLFSLSILGLKVLVPYSLAALPDIDALSNAEVARILNLRYLAMGIVGLFGYLWLHLRAARIYASAVAAALRDGDITQYQLSPRERTVFASFGLLSTAGSNVEFSVRHGARRTARGAVFLAGTGATLVVWFGVVAQVYVGQFMHYVPVQGWFNQPMIHAPWFNYTPGYLSAGAGEPALPATKFTK